MQRFGIIVYFSVMSKAEIISSFIKPHYIQKLLASKKSVRIYKIDRTVPSESDVVCTYRGLEKALKGITKTYNNANRNN